MKLTKAVGTDFQYSNTNYLIAGLIVEVVSAQSFASYIQDHIFTPLGLSHSHTSEAEAIADGLATGYRWWFGVPVPGRVPYLDDALPAAFLACSAEDLAHYLVACLDAGCTNHTLLSEVGFAELFRPQSSTAIAGASYALGWRVESSGGEHRIRHSGEVATFRCEMLLLPESRTGIVVLANYNNGLIADLGLDRIVPGIVSILQRKQPETRTLTFRRFYLLLDVAIGLLSAFQVLRTWRLSMAMRCSRVETILGTLVDLVAPIAVLTALPRWFDAPWSLLRVYVPDIAAWLRLVMLPLSVLSLIVRMVRFFNEK